VRLSVSFDPSVRSECGITPMDNITILKKI
jgi:hypothetical protein